METQISKTQQAIAYYHAGDFKNALKLASSFRLGLTEGERRVLKTGYECLMYPGFYRQLGTDIDWSVHHALSVFSRLWIAKD